MSGSAKCGVGVPLLDPVIARTVMTILLQRLGGKVTVTRGEYEAVSAALGDMVAVEVSISKDMSEFTVELKPSEKVVA